MKKECKAYRIVVGDIHGDLSVFNKIYEKEKEAAGNEVFEVMLLGDYFDTHKGIKYEQQIESFKYLLDLQKKHLKEHGDFIMLIGNHDFQYLDDSGTEHYSGYNPATYAVTHPLLMQARNKHKLKFAEVDIVNRTIYSHAGVTNTWLHERGKIDNPVNLIDVLPYHLFKFTYGSHFDCYGNDPLNSPIWVRPGSLIPDMYKDIDMETKQETTWTQIVGHTPCMHPIVAHEDDSQWKEDEMWQFAKFYDMDCLDKGYYLLETFDEDGKIENREIKNILTE